MPGLTVPVGARRALSAHRKLLRLARRSWADMRSADTVAPPDGSDCLPTQSAGTVPRRGPGARRCCGGAGAARAGAVVPGARGAEARGVRRPRRRDPARPGRAGRRRRSPHRCVRQWWRRRPRRGATGDPGAHRFDHRHEAVCRAVSPGRARCAPGGDPSARRRDLRQRQGRRGVDRRGARAVCAGRSEDAWRGACGNAADPAPGGGRARSRTNRRACLLRPRGSRRSSPCCSR